MSRYIDADKLKVEMMRVGNNAQMKRLIIETYIDTAPTADVRQNIYGRWLKAGNLVDDICSVCGKVVFQFREEYIYCPYCGSEMRKEKTE